MNSENSLNPLSTNKMLKNKNKRKRKINKITNIYSTSIIKNKNPKEILCTANIQE